MVFLRKEAGMADAHTGASAERFEVRVTADSHFCLAADPPRP